METVSNFTEAVFPRFQTLKAYDLLNKQKIYTKNNEIFTLSLYCKSDPHITGFTGQL